MKKIYVLIGVLAAAILMSCAARQDRYARDYADKIIAEATLNTELNEVLATEATAAEQTTAAETTTTEPTTEQALSVEQLADAVLRGEYGNGEERKAALGDRYEEVQRYIDANYQQQVTSKLNNADFSRDVIDYVESGGEKASYWTPADLRYHGVIYWGGWRFTWYSENVLPGGGLHIPGRWSDTDFVKDENGYICVACEDLPWGTVVETPWGTGRVYDCGCAHGTIDIYTTW